MRYEERQIERKSLEKKLLRKNKIDSRKIMCIGIVACLSLLMIIFAIFTPKVTLKGDKTIYLKYPKTYKENGYTVSYMGKKLNEKVSIKGKVNPKKVGTYHLEYSVKKGVFTGKATRQVVVEDTEKPKITLKGTPDTDVCPSKKYEEEGFTATDNYDGDLTKKVKVTKDEDKITYEVSDSSKNKTKLVRKLAYQDKTKPIITLKGDANFYVTVGGTYTEPGFTAQDNCNGDITKDVKVEGTVNASVAGTYTLTYKAKDEAGNEASVERKVIVYQKSSGGSGCGPAGTIYLTFDDGPESGPTTKILDILKQEGVKATFFVTGKGPDALIKREHDEGHVVAFHTNTHNYAKLYSSVDAYFADLTAVENRVKRITGSSSKIVRFPGGSSNTISKKYSPGIMTTLTREVVNRGYRYYDWNTDSDDAGKCAANPTPTCVYNQTIANLSKNRCNMILMHDIKMYTANALQDVIRYAKQNGYTFKVIDQNTPMVKHGVNN